jgi:AcrR family transcriptional regulator
VGVAERREREREQLRAAIIDAARDLLLEQGLQGLSMRAIADRVEYSPATIYLYFRDKDDLIREVVQTGFERLSGAVARELEREGAGADPATQYGAMGRGYAHFALENPAYFRVMFELPATAQLCEPSGEAPVTGLDQSVAMVQQAMDAGQLGAGDARRTAIVGWGLIHGLTTLYLAGHLRNEIRDADEFIQLIEDAMQSIYVGWRPDPAGEAA